MSADDFERGIESLLDGRSLGDDGNPSDRAIAGDPLRVVDAISRAHRTAIFGRDVSPDRSSATRWGHLEVRGEIGRGANGTVYRAWDERLARQVALKLLDSEAQPDEAALEEGRLLARLNHPHIVRVFGADSHDGVAGIWMELLEGDTLDEILSRDGLFGVDETLLIGRDLASALRAVHSAGLLHRDIKGRNVLRERGGRIVLMDLGAGRAVDRTGVSSDGTGTPMYMAPEVLTGGAATVQSDIYCLGVLLYRLLTAKLPVTAANGAELRAAHTRGDRVSLGQVRTDLTADITATIERACDPDPSARYASAAEFEDALAAAFQRRAFQQNAVASSLARTFARWKTAVGAAALTTAITMAVAWGGWDVNIGRSLRRILGLTVPPRSTLYLTLGSGLGIVRNGELTLIAHNPTTAVAISVSSDLGVRTMAGGRPWTTGGSFHLDGTEAAPSLAINELCCFSDGTTDGHFNYAVRQDTAPLQPLESRPLAPPALYRFERDWSDPRLMFPVEPPGLYGGIAYSNTSQLFWLTRKVGEGSVVELWDRAGKHLATPIHLLGTTMTIGIAIDSADDTVWAVRTEYAVGVIRLENFDQSGQRLGSLDLPLPHPTLGGLGAEFAWPKQ